MSDVAASVPQPRKGGRPPGSVGKPTRMSRTRATELAEAHRTPLDLMLQNMNFWWDRATALTTQMEEMLVAAKAKEFNAEDFGNATKLMKEFLIARDKAQQCAVEAAPYVHPRFQSIEFRGELDVRDTRKIKEITSVKEAANAYADTLHTPANANAPYAPPIFTTVKDADKKSTVAA